MPANWTGALIGNIHNAGLTIKEVSARAKLNPKYVSKVLNSNKQNQSARKKLNDALSELIAEQEQK